MKPPKNFELHTKKFCKSFAQQQDAKDWTKFWYVIKQSLLLNSGRNCSHLEPCMMNWLIYNEKSFVQVDTFGEFFEFILTRKHRKISEHTNFFVRKSRAFLHLCKNHAFCRLIWRQNDWKKDKFCSFHMSSSIFEFFCSKMSEKNRTVSGTKYVMKQILLLTLLWKSEESID